MSNTKRPTGTKPAPAIPTPKPGEIKVYQVDSYTGAELDAIEAETGVDLVMASIGRVVRILTWWEARKRSRYADVTWEQANNHWPNSTAGTPAMRDDDEDDVREAAADMALEQAATGEDDGHPSTGQ